MKLNELREGLEIVSRYYDDPTGFHVGAEHDVLYAYATDKRMSDVDIQRMIELGWLQEHDERDYDKDFSIEDYRQEESWIAYNGC